mgnify:CR=1 FL=1
MIMMNGICLIWNNGLFGNKAPLQGAQVVVPNILAIDKSPVQGAVGMVEMILMQLPARHPYRVRTLEWVCGDATDKTSPTGCGGWINNDYRCFN